MSVAEQSSQIDYLRRLNSLEEGRSQVLRLVARGEDINNVLNLLCEKAQIYSPEMYCSILRLDQETQTLHPAASVSLSDDYCNALDGVKIGSGVGSCGTAAFIKGTVIVEDINTHPYWNQYKELALQFNLQACWSEPIIGTNGRVYGTFAMYYNEPKAPNEEDLKFIEVSANLAAVVFENEENKQKLLAANNLLNQTIDKRTAELEATNRELEKALQAQKQLHLGHVAEQKMLTTNRLLCGFAHELNTPLGIAVLAMSSIDSEVDALDQANQNNSIKKRELSQRLKVAKEAISLSKNNLNKMDELITRFKKMDTASQYSCQQEFSVKEFIASLKQACNSLLDNHSLEVDVQDIHIQGSSVGLFQIFYQLIENSVVHGFRDKCHGVIHIDIKRVENKVYINYQDDGCGIPSDQSDNIFEPFYSINRLGSNLGLGLSVVKGIVTQNYAGSIQLIPSPIGARFEIVFSQ